MMAEMITIPKENLARLEERIRNLALEKSNLQLVNDLMSRLSAVPGLENTTEAIVRLILDNIGGSNVAIYYLVGSELHFADVYGARTRVEVVEDPLARKAFEMRKFILEVREFEETQMTTPEFTKASNWALPLLVGDKLIGVLKMDGMLLAAKMASEHLQPFFDYAALILNNEIEGHLKLTEAARLAAIVQSSDDAIIGKTLDGTITSWNKGAERIYGYDELEMVGRPVSLLLPPGLDDEVPGILARLKKGEHIEHYETRRQRKDGQIIHLSLTISPIRDVQGRIVAASSIGHDISERKQAEQEIALMSFALNNVQEAAFLIDEQGRFRFVNEESCRSLDYTRLELLALSVADVNPDFPTDCWPGHWKDLKARRSLVFEGRHRTKNGRVFPVEINANYFEYDGRSYNLALVRDITERKRAEESLRMKSEELDQRVKERTAELEAKNKDLERMNELFVGRELRMVELKERISALSAELKRRETSSI